MNFQKITHDRPAKLIIENIQEMIFDGRLKPGEKLPPERELVEEFNVSKVTLREALGVLEAFNLIEKKRGIGGGSIILAASPQKAIQLLDNYFRMENTPIEQLMDFSLLIIPRCFSIFSEVYTNDDRDFITDQLERYNINPEEDGVNYEGVEILRYIAQKTNNNYLNVNMDLILIAILRFMMGTITKDESISFLKIVKKEFIELFEIIFTGKECDLEQAAYNSLEVIVNSMKLQLSKHV